MVLFSTLLTSVGQIFFKFFSQQISLDFFALITNYSLILGFLFYGLGAMILIIALKYGELSILYPIYSLSYVWVSILSPNFFPSDSMNLMKWVGIFIIILGVTFVSKGGGKI